MIKDLLDQILSQTYTQTQALARLRVLKDLVLLQLFGHGYKKQANPLKLPPNQQTNWLVTLNQEIFKNFTKDNAYQIFDELEREIRTIKPLVVCIPFELPEEGITELGQYLRKIFGKNFMAEIKIDPSLIAGTALVWNGVYKDYSIRNKISDNRDQILHIIKEYLKK